MALKQPPLPKGVAVGGGGGAWPKALMPTAEDAKEVLGLVRALAGMREDGRVYWAMALDGAKEVLKMPEALAEECLNLLLAEGLLAEPRLGELVAVA